MSQINSALSKASFTPYNNANVHHHDHRHTPHVHSQECERYLSGFDKNRQTRFYFTKGQTACRVYLSYNEKLLSTSTTDFTTTDKEKLSQLNTMLNGRKLSPRTLRTQLKISPQFIEDAKNFVFVKETMSLIPPISGLPPIFTNAPLTMAEMAVIPINLPVLNGPNGPNQKNSGYKYSKQPQQQANTKLSAKLTSSSTNSLTNSDISKL